MQAHLYLSLIPEALVFSMLSPREFGRYLALGAESRTREQAIFMEVDRTKLNPVFNLEEMEKRCVPHADGRPHRSTYLAIYRALEHIPIAALGSCYLVSRDGTSLEIVKSHPTSTESNDHKFHLYQELCPVMPLVVARLRPKAFGSHITSSSEPVSVPRIVFAELNLGPLTQNPNAPETNLPYRNLPQIRFSLNELLKRPEKQTKIVERNVHDLPFWMIEGGIYVSDPTDDACYRMSTEEELRKSHFDWWSSARAVEVL